ncbi:MAG: hypothetical protein ACWGQW_00710 [bacterium]
MEISKNAQMVLDIFSTVLSTIGMPIPVSGKVISAMDRLGIDHMMALDWGRSMYLNYDVRPTFSLQTSVSIRLEIWDGSKHRLEVRVKWPSGGGDVVTALAEATQHVECVTKAARAETILAHELGRRLKKDELGNALEELSKLRDWAREQITAELNCNS